MLYIPSTPPLIKKSDFRMPTDCVQPGQRLFPLGCGLAVLELYHELCNPKLCETEPANRSTFAGAFAVEVHCHELLCGQRRLMRRPLLQAGDRGAAPEDVAVLVEDRHIHKHRVGKEA